MTNTIGRERCAVSGPFQTEREARGSVQHILASPPGTGVWGAGNLRLLEDACRAAGVQLGAYDYRILVWLTAWEPSTCAVIAGLITRAATGRLSATQRSTVLAALDVAADYKRDRAANCPDCETSPAELCGTCEWRLERAEGYDALAALLREVTP
jgi:hypothetical protein